MIKEATNVINLNAGKDDFIEDRWQDLHQVGKEVSRNNKSYVNTWT